MDEVVPVGAAGGKTGDNTEEVRILQCSWH